MKEQKNSSLTIIELFEPVNLCELKEREEKLSRKSHSSVFIFLKDYSMCTSVTGDQFFSEKSRENQRVKSVQESLWERESKLHGEWGDSDQRHGHK